MQIVFESRDSEGANMRDLSVERVRFALRRLTTFVAHARVQFSDINGPRGGVDKRCQIELKTDTAGTVVIASLAQGLAHRTRSVAEPCHAGPGAQPATHAQTHARTQREARPRGLP
jgi:hypothetical protein